MHTDTVCRRARRRIRKIPLAPTRRGPSLLVLVGMLVLASLGLTGCVEVEVRDVTPAADVPGKLQDSPLVAEERDRDVGILAVEFDPPLDYKRLILSPQSVSLLVAVENTGARTERDVAVRAELSSLEDPDMLLSDLVLVDSIAPGEIQVVRFPPLQDIPRMWRYHLEVLVDALEGESNLADNAKSLDIEIHPQ